MTLARRTEIGASSHLLKVGGKSIILDAGMHPKGRGLEAQPEYQRVPEGSVDAIVVTHAHQDHIGSLPVLTRREQEARVFMSEGTFRIGEMMLRNSVNVMTRQREEEGLTEYPLFTHRGIDFSKQMWSMIPAGRQFTLDGERGRGDGFEPTVELYHAGHILGSSGVLVRGEGKSVFYTGDVNFDDQTLMQGAEFPEEGVDTLIMETTRGDSPSAEGFTRKGEERRFIDAIEEAFERGGSVTIPVFALGKTQEVLAILWEAQKRGRLRGVPLYIGGLSTKITTAYDRLAESPDRSHNSLQLLSAMSPYVMSGPDAHTLAMRDGCIFAISSGMMTENTLSNKFVRKVLPDPRQSLFFVGYSDPDSPAGKVRVAKSGDSVLLDKRLPEVELNCDVQEFNFSAHAPRERILEYAVRLRPKRIVLVHGDPPAVEWFRSQLVAALPETEVVLPDPGGATMPL
ncbi:MAG: MBL fold metallo-hydrolase [Chthoniobacterales bacterium]